MTLAILKKRNNSTLLFAICLLVVWQIFGGSVLFPKPSSVLQRLNIHIIPHILATLKRVFVALVAGMSIGFCVGIATGDSRSRLIDIIIGKPAAFLMPIPGIALVPLSIILLGFGDITIIAIGILASFFPVAYNTAAALRGLNHEPIEAAMIDGACQRVTFWRIKIPLALPSILMGIRLSIARCWRTIIATEFIAAANYGIGYMIWDSAEYLQTEKVWLGIFVMGLLFLLFEKGIVAIERLAASWI